MKIAYHTLFGTTLVWAFIQLTGELVPVKQSQAEAIGAAKFDVSLIIQTLHINPSLALHLVYLWVLLAAVICLIAPILEELVFRKGLITLLSKFVSVEAAMVVSSLLFAVAHLNPWVVPHLFVTGLWFAQVYRKYGYWSAAACHATFNTMTFAILVLL